MATQRLTIEGQSYILLREQEYERLRKEALVHMADENLPALPLPNANGRLPAVSYARRSLARDIIQARRGAGWNQAELAHRAGIRRATLARIEFGDHTAAPKTVDKIMKAIASANPRQRRKKAR